MIDAAHMVATVEAYVAAFEQGSADAVADLYAENATVEDPIGSPIHRGREAVRAFYAESMKTGAKLKLLKSLVPLPSESVPLRRLFIWPLTALWKLPPLPR